MKVAVIPARGGSKRIPRKNIREFAGKPMIAHSVICAVESGLFGRVIVSTDDDEIAAVAVRYGAEVPFRRPPELADDYAVTTSVMAHAVDWLHSQGAALSAVCCIYATAPFIRADDLQQGSAMLDAADWQYVFSATKYSFPVFRSFQKQASGGLKMLFPEHFNTRSQDLPETLHDAGQFYWGRPAAWSGKKNIFDSNSTVVLIPPWRVQDIDTPDDWVRAEQQMSIISGKDHAQIL